MFFGQRVISLRPGYFESACLQSHLFNIFLFDILFFFFYSHNLKKLGDRPSLVFLSVLFCALFGKPVQRL